MQFFYRVGRSLKYRSLYLAHRLFPWFSRQNYGRLLRKLGRRFVQTRVGKMQMWIDLQSELGQYFFIHHQYELFETRLIAQAALPGTVAVDVGANIGYYTLILAANVGATGTVIAIEPDPTNMSLLSRNLALNRASNVICRQVAVLGYEGQATLYRSETNDGDHRVFDARDDDRFNNGIARTRVPVQTIVLDNYLASIGKQAGLVKMDIQGAEMLALPGMTQTLANPNVILFCEFWPYGLRQAGSDPMQFLKSLQELGLVLFEIVEAKQIVAPITIDELAHRFNDADYTNLICVHPSRIPHTPFLNV